MRTDTLRFHLNRPAFQKGRPLLSSTAIIAAQMDVKTPKTPANPEEEALRFYMINHALAELQLSYDLDAPLPYEVNDLCETLVADLNSIVARFFTYITLICARESRHARKKIGFHPEMAEKFGPAYRDFNKSLKGMGSSQAVSTFKDSPPETAFHTFATALAWTFYEGEYSSGYGGKAWGQVADCLKGFATGETNAETMVDVGWTLCHNGGPIFNKGMQYEMYTKTDLYTVLDVQRAGQIPALVGQQMSGGQFFMTQCSAQGVTSLWHKCNDVLDWKTRYPYVDWLGVEASGAVQKYSHYAAAQITQGLLTPEQAATLSASQQAAIDASKAKAEIAAKKAKDEAKFLATHFELALDQYIEIVELERTE